MAETGRWSDYIITKAGRTLRQLCIAEGKKTVFTKAVIGTGKPTDPSTIENMSALVNYAKDVIHKKSYAVEENHLAIVRVDNSGYTSSVQMTETAVYAKLENQTNAESILFGYAYNIDGYVDIPAQTSITNRKIFEITLDTTLSRSIEIELIFDSSSLFVSHLDMDDHASSAATHPYTNPDMPGVENIKQALDYIESHKPNIGTPESSLIQLNQEIMSENQLWPSIYSRDAFGTITGSISLHLKKPLAINTYHQIATIPIADAPNDIRYFSVIHSNSTNIFDNKVGAGWIFKDGTVNVSLNSSDSIYLIANFSYR